MKKLMVAGLFIVMALAVSGLFFTSSSDFPTETKEPTDKSVTIEKIADDAFSEPRIYDQGFAADTPYISIIFDDGHDDWYDSVLVWNQHGFVFGFGVPRNGIGTSGTDSLTATEVQYLYNYRNEILNHFWAMGKAYYFSFCGEDKLEKQINDTYRYFIDTLGVGIYDLPGEIGGDLPAGDRTIISDAKVAENHYYCTGGTANQANSYEADSVLAWDQVTIANRWFRYCGSIVPWGIDTLHTGTWGPTTADTVYYAQKNLIFQNAIANRWTVPACFTNGPSPTSGNIWTEAQARVATRFAIKNNAAATFFFHRDSTATWFSDWLWWVRSLEDSGYVTIKRPYELVRDWQMRPMKMGVNLFPNPHFQRVSWNDNPDGLFFGLWNNITGANNDNVAWYVKSDSTGFDGNQYAEIFPGGNNHHLVWGTRVPRNCYIYASCRIKGFGAFDTASDSMMVALHIQGMSPNLNDAEDANSTTSFEGWNLFTTSNSGFQQEPSGAPLSSVNAGYTWDAGFDAAVRWVHGDESVWKTLEAWSLAEEAGYYLITLDFNTKVTAASGRGISIDDFTVYLAPGPAPGR